MSGRPPGPRIGACVPTVGRADQLEALIGTLVEQTYRPDLVVVVDASEGSRVEQICRREWGIDVRHVDAAPGLPAQREIGAALLIREGMDLICMLDDDVLLDRDYLGGAVTFLSGAEGRGFGGVCGYDAENWGTPFRRIERFYARLGIFDELRPGRWFYCGAFLQLDRLGPIHGIFETDFLPGSQSVWRQEVFREFRQPVRLGGYALGEDKHFSLRVASRYKLGVLGGCVARHKLAAGFRPKRFRLGMHMVRHAAIILRDCDPSPTARRYVAFLAFTLLDVTLRALGAVTAFRFRALGVHAGSLVGWMGALVSPPERDAHALGADTRARAP